MNKKLLTTAITLLLCMGIQPHAHADLNCNTENWTAVVGTLSGDEAPENNSDVISGGIMRIPPSLSSNGYYWTRFRLPIPLGFSGDDAKLEVRVKNSSAEGGIAAYDTSLWIAGNGDGTADKSAGVVLMGDSWGQSWDGLYAVDSNIRQIPELILSLNDWHVITIETKNGMLSVYNDGVKIKELFYSGKVGMIKYVEVSFKGSGSIDELKLYEKEEIVTHDTFDNVSSRIQVCKNTPEVLVPQTGTVVEDKPVASGMENGVCSISQTAAMQVGGNGAFSSSSAAEVYDFGGNSATKTCTNVGLPTDKPKDPFYEFVYYVYDKKIDDAVAIIPTLLGYLAEKSPDSLKKNLIKISGDSFVSNRLLTAQIKESLTAWQTLNIKEMGIDFVADKATDWVSQYVSKQIGGSTGRYVGGAVWFAMKQSWGVYKAKGEAGGFYSPLFPLALLKAQSDLLMTVVKKDIEELGIVQTSLISAIESKMRGDILKGEATLIDDERAYFRAETVSEKNKIRTRMIAKQKAFLKPHLTGKKEFISKSKATQMFNTWKTEFPGRLVKEEFGTRAKLSALISLGKFDEAKTLAEAFFGRNVDVFSDQIVIKDDVLTDF